MTTVKKILFVTEETVGKMVLIFPAMTTRIVQKKHPIASTEYALQETREIPVVRVGIAAKIALIVPEMSVMMAPRVHPVVAPETVLLLLLIASMIPASPKRTHPEKERPVVTRRTAAHLPRFVTTDTAKMEASAMNATMLTAVISTQRSVLMGVVTPSGWRAILAEKTVTVPRRLRIACSDNAKTGAWEIVAKTIEIAERWNVCVYRELVGPLVMKVKFVNMIATVTQIFRRVLRELAML